MNNHNPYYTPEELMLIREDLDKIDRILKSRGDTHPRVSAALCNVLAATRGPDDEDERLKEAGTAWVRTTAFPTFYPESNHFSYGSDEPAPAPWWSDKSAEPLSGFVSYDTHFRSHIQYAFWALGIIKQV